MAIAEQKTNNKKTGLMKRKDKNELIAKPVVSSYWQNATKIDTRCHRENPHALFFALVQFHLSKIVTKK